MGTVFNSSQVRKPLAERMRPETLYEYVGQEHLLGTGGALRQMMESDTFQSMILWGPPGTGKTTLARVIAGHTRSEFVSFSAASNGIKEIKDAMKQAEQSAIFGIRTVLFVDELHRFNKSQQDAFLPYVEKGVVILIGATTENPSFEVNAALLSRCKVFVLNPLSVDELTQLLSVAQISDKGYNGRVFVSKDLLSVISAFANGDARTALNTLEMVVTNTTPEQDGSVHVTKETVEKCIGKKTLLYDKGGENHYDLISALHKSMRNTDPDAALYWLARMLEAGEDPLFVARRLVRFASEDVGMADPQALPQAVAAYQACHFIGMPECNVNLAQAVVYLSLAPRSNAMETAYDTAREDAIKQIAEPVPLHIRNAPTQLMKNLHYGEGYVYAHDTERKIARMDCLPESLKGRRYYMPTEEGYEKEWKARLQESLEYRRGDGT